MRTFSVLSSSRLALVAMGTATGRRSLKRLTSSCTSGQAEIARAADGDDGVVDALPDAFVGQHRRVEQLGHEVFRPVVHVAIDLRDPAIFEHLGAGVAGVEGAHIGEGKLDEPALAHDLRERLHGVRHLLVHEVKAVADVALRGGVVRDAVAGHDEDAVGFRAQIGDGLDGALAPGDALEGEGLHADDDDLRAGLVAELDKVFRERHAGPAGKAEHEDEEIAGVGDIGEVGLLDRDDLTRQIDITTAAEAVHEAAAEKTAVGHDGAFDTALIGIEHPKILLRAAVEHELVADGGAGLGRGRARARGREKVDWPFSENGPSGVNSIMVMAISFSMGLIHQLQRFLKQENMKG